MGNGCTEEGLRDRLMPGQPQLTTAQVIAMYITAIKVPGYTSAWEDPHCVAWGKKTEPKLIPKGDNGKPLYNAIYQTSLLQQSPSHKAIPQHQLDSGAKMSSRDRKMRQLSRLTKRSSAGPSLRGEAPGHQLKDKPPTVVFPVHPQPLTHLSQHHHNLQWQRPIHGKTQGRPWLQPEQVAAISNRK
eukprot:6779195-Karenia_brevis.AAC.1